MLNPLKRKTIQAYLSPLRKCQGEQGAVAKPAASTFGPPDENNELKPGTLEHTLYALKFASQAQRPTNPAAITLRILWQLNNPFVNPSTEVQHAYQRELIARFAAVNSAEAWTNLAGQAAAALQPLLRKTVDADGKRRTSCNLRELARDATMKTTLYWLFGVDDASPAMVTYLGSEIHRLAEGKRHFDKGAGGRWPEKFPLDLRQSAQRVRDASRDACRSVKDSSRLMKELICSVSGTQDDYNPVNLIKPAFDLPWRATYYALISVLQGPPSRIQYLKALRDCKPQDQPSMGARAVAYEILRLYPPIRRVRRDIVEKVDIEAVQRDARYWGPTAGLFDPSRFLDVHGNIDSSRTSATNAWLPFGAGNMKCPAANGFAVRLFVVLTGEILRQLFPEDQCLEWSIDGPEWYASDKNGDTLRPGRDEYGSIWLTVCH